MREYQQYLYGKYSMALIRLHIPITAVYKCPCTILALCVKSRKFIRPYAICFKR